MDKKDPPIEPLEYRLGLTVVDIGDLRVARGMSRRPVSACRHLDIRYDSSERRIWCADCETDIDPFDAFTSLCENYDAALKRFERKKSDAESAMRHSLFSRASKEMDKLFRKRGYVPACPTCGHGIFPEAVVKGLRILGRDYAAARLAKLENPAQ